MAETSSENVRPSSPIADIVRKGSVITIITLVSRPLGYVREAIQAYLFGATILVDAFIIAFNFPELIQTLFLTGATSAFLIPVCTQYLKDDGEYSDIYSTFVNLSVIITAVLSLLLVVFSTSIVSFIAPGFTADGKYATTSLFLIMVPVILLHTILSVMKAFMNAKEHFAAPELSGIVWNIVFILCALFLSKRMGIYSLAVGVTIGSLFQIIVQIPYLKKLNIRYTPRLLLKHPAIGEAKRLFAGALIATSIVPINTFFGRVIGSYLPGGEVAALAYAFRIFILPASLFAVPVYTVMFARISRIFHDNKREDIFPHIDGSLILLCITLVPATVLLCSTGNAMVAILYERGVFTPYDTSITTRALVGYGSGLLFYALSISFVRIFNAFHDVRTPALIGLTSIALNALLAALLMRRWGNMGISLATSIVSFYNFTVLFILFAQRHGYRPARKTVREIAKSLVAGVLLLAAILATKASVHLNHYVTLASAGVLTAVIYGIFFKSYYGGLIKRRI